MTATPVTATPVTATPVLELRDLTAGYGRATVLRDVTLSVAPGQIAALLGPNGAGKTTLLRVAAGVTRSRQGAVVIDGSDLTRQAPHVRARAGVCLIPEGRGIFRHLTVKENLAMQIPPGHRAAGFDRGIEAFPVLGKRLSQKAGTMSGGQQQMLALARCFIARPKIVLLDEVSMGLAPQVIDEIFAALTRLAAEGVALLLVEQYVARALELSHQVHLLNGGSLTFSGPPSQLDSEAVLAGYLGANRNNAQEEAE